MEITINKIQITGKGISINYDIPCDSSQRKTVKISCEQDARAEFYSAMNGLLEDVIDALGLDKEIWAKGVVTGIDFKDAEIKISAVNKINQVYVTITTPNISTASEGLESKIEEITHEATEYIDGKRAQMSLLDRNGEVIEIRQFQMN